MSVTELWRLDAAALVAGYRTGAFTPAQATQACLDRIEQVQPRINAFVHVDAAGACTAALASQARWAVSDRVIFMHQGRVHEMGPPQELFGNPQTPELKQFLSSLH